MALQGKELFLFSLSVCAMGMKFSASAWAWLWERQALGTGSPLPGGQAVLKRGAGPGGWDPASLPFLPHATMNDALVTALLSCHGPGCTENKGKGTPTLTQTTNHTACLHPHTPPTPEESSPAPPHGAPILKREKPTGRGLLAFQIRGE